MPSNKTRAVTTSPGLSFLIAPSDATTRSKNRVLASVSVNFKTCPLEDWSSKISKTLSTHGPLRVRRKSVPSSSPGRRHLFLTGCRDSRAPGPTRTSLSEVSETTLWILRSAEQELEKPVVHWELGLVVSLSVQVETVLSQYSDDLLFESRRCLFFKRRLCDLTHSQPCGEALSCRVCE